MQGCGETSDYLTKMAAKGIELQTFYGFICDITYFSTVLWTGVGSSKRLHMTSL